MTKVLKQAVVQGAPPAVQAISDLPTFRLARLVAITDRAGQRWTRREFGISLNEWRVIGLTCASSPLPIAQLRNVLLMDKGQLSRLIKGLEDKALILKQASSKDARSIELVITDKGRGLHDRALRYAAARNEVVTQTLTQDECETFLTLLGKLTAHNEDLLNKAEQNR